MFSSIRELVESEGIHLNQARGDEMRTPCLFHDDSDKKGHLYINVKENIYFCHRCGEKGNGRMLAKHLGQQWVDDGSGEVFGEKYFDKLKIYDTALAYYMEQLQSNPHAMKYLKDERGLSKELIEKAKIGWAPAHGLLVYLKDRGISVKDAMSTGLVNESGQEFFHDKIIIAYMSAGHCVQLRGKQIGGKYLTPPDQEARMYGLDTIKDAEEVVICEGEFDALAARQAGFTAVAVPGAGVFKEEWAAWFEGVRRVYICLDADDAGEAGAENISKIIGRRTRIVKLPKAETRKSIDLNEYFLEGATYEDFSELCRTSEGKRLLRMGEIRKRWIENRSRDDGIFPKLILGFDHVLRPGFQRGQLITLLAKTGAGKSVAMLNMAYQNRETVPQIIVSLELTAEEVYERMRRISLFFNPQLTDDEVDMEWSKVLVCDENRMSGRDFEDLLHEYEDEMGIMPHLIWVDYLGYFARSYKGDEYQRLSDAVMDLKHLAKKHKVIIFTPHQVNRSGKDGRPLEADMARGSGVIEETSDFCFALWRPHEAEENENEEAGSVMIRILKSRHGGKGTQFSLLQAPQSLAYVPADNLPMRNYILREYQIITGGKTWDELHELRRGRGETGPLGK